MEIEELKQQGNNELKKGNIEEAINIFTKAISIDDKNAILYSNRAAAYGMVNLWKEALEDAEKSLELRPEWSKAYSRKGLALYKLCRYEESIQTYNKALQFDPCNTDLPKNITTVQNAWKASEQNVLGEELLHKNKFNVAIGFFMEASTLDPSNSLYWSNLSFCQCNLGLIDDALESSDKVIAYRPKWHKGYQRKAEAYYAKKEYEKSASIYAYALQIAPDNAQLNTGFTNAHSKASNPETIKKGEKSTWASIKEFIGI